MARLVLHPRDRVIGSPDTAAVQLVMYGDLECPHSRRGIVLVGELMHELADALLFAFRDFPLVRLHPHALNAAIAAEAAGRQGRYWDMMLELYRHQHTLDDDALRSYADAIGLAPRRFALDFASDATRARVLEDLASGEALGVRSTPTFFVNGVLYDGKVDGVTALVEEAVTAASAPGAH